MVYVFGDSIMIDPEDIPRAVAKLKERIKVKNELIKFTEMEVGELIRTIDKMVIKN